MGHCGAVSDGMQRGATCEEGIRKPSLYPLSYGGVFGLLLRYVADG